MSSWREEKFKPLIDSMAKDRNIDAEAMIKRLESNSSDILKPMSNERREEVKEFFDAMDGAKVFMMPLNKYDDKGKPCGIDWKGSTELLKDKYFVKKVFESI